MPIILYFAIAFLVVAAIATLIAAVATDSESKSFAKLVAAVTAVLGGVVLPLVSAITIVPANEVGVATHFGRWAGTLQSGWHFTAPWTKVESFPTRIQKSERDRGEKGEADCVPVKFLGGATGCVDLTVLYRIDAANAETLWRGWGSFKTLNNDLVNRSTDDAAGYTFGSRAPYDAVNGNNRQALTTDLGNRLRGVLDEKGIDLDSVTLGAIHLDGAAQAQVNDLLNKDTAIKAAQKDADLREAQKAADIRAAEKDRDLAIAERNAQNERQGTLTREYLILECLRTADRVKPQVMPDCGLSGQTGATPLVQVSR